VKRFLALAALVGSASCASSVSVKPVDADSAGVRGIRYCLPQPFLVITPQEDGSVTARWHFLADRSQEYAVDAWSLLGKHKLEIKTIHGLLASVDWKGEADAVAAEAVKAAGEIRKQELESDIESAKASAAQQAKLRDALDAAILERDLAQAKYDAVHQLAPGSQADFDAFVALETAKRRVAYYQGQLDGDAFDAATDSAMRPTKPTVTIGKRHGPVWFRLDECGGVLQLVAVDVPGSANLSQGVFDTYTLAPKPQPAPTPPVPARVEFENAELRVPRSKLDESQPVALKTAVDSVKDFQLDGAAGIVDGGVVKLELKNSKQLGLVLKADLHPGTYQLSFKALLPDKKTVVTGLLDVVVIGGQ